MRKFTLFFSFLLIGAMAFAQQPVVTEVWNNSVYGNADWSSGIPIGGETPDWMGNLTERGMAHYDGKLFMVSRNENPIVVVELDAATGEHLSSMPIDTSVVKGGTFAANDIVITPSGKILVASLAIGHDSPFKVYMLEDNGEGGYDATQLLEYYTTDSIDGVEQPTKRLGDSFAFYGDISEEEDGYLLVADATATEEQKVLKWNVQAGVFDAEPEEIVITEVLPAPEEGAVPKFSTTPRIWPVSNDLFWADGHATFPALYNMQGELISTFTGGTAPVQAGVSGVSFFTFQNHDFVLAPTTNWANPTGYPPNAFQLFSIPEGGAEEADSIAIFPERGMAKESNASFSYPIGIDVQDEQVMMYIMVPNNGIAAFKLTMEEEVTAGEWNISTDDFNALGELTETTTVNGLTIFAHSGKTVTIDENSKSLEGMDFTHRLKLGGSGDFDDDGMPLGRVVAFDVSGNAKITVMGMSSSSSEDRELHLAAGHEDEIFATFPALGEEISKGEYFYTGEATTIYLYSPSSGVNIYYLKVEEGVEEPPAEGEWNFSLAAFNALGDMIEDTTVNGLNIHANSERNVTVDENEKELNGMVFTHRLKLNGSGKYEEDGSIIGRVLSFEVEGNTNITVIGMSSSDASDRELAIAAGTPDNIFATFDALGGEISEGVFYYQGEATTIYLYSTDSGVNLYMLKAESVPTNFKPIEDRTEEVRVYPNPATDGKVFVNVQKPTQVAVFNMAGSMVKSQLVESENDFISVNDLQPGMYIIRSQMSDDFAEKLIVR
ncbi:MAG: T9SS type A sorting domain-containing protein [Bacteroidota bacterium]